MAQITNNVFPRLRYLRSNILPFNTPNTQKKHYRTRIETLCRALCPNKVPPTVKALGPTALGAFTVVGTLLGHKARHGGLNS